MNSWRSIKSVSGLLALLLFWSIAMATALPANAHDSHDMPRPGPGLDGTHGELSPGTVPSDGEADHGQCHGNTVNCHAMAMIAKAFGGQDANYRKKSGRGTALLWSGVQSAPPHKPPIAV